MRHSDEYLDVRHSRARGTSRLYQQTWLPDTAVRAVVLLVHGLGEHSSRYTHVARHLTDCGFAVYALDHYGHGKSDGHAGFVERFSVYLDGVAALLQKIRDERAELPVFLLGHSMGGLIGTAFLIDHQDAFRAAVLSGPAIESDQAPPPIVMAIVRLLSALLPTVPLIQLDASGVSRDKNVVTNYINDPLVHHGKLSARLLAEMSAAMQNTLARAGDIELPIIVMHGEDDRLTSPAGSDALIEAIGSADKTLKTYPGLYHEIFNEPEQDAVLADMSRWLETHL
ncbi:MAG: lysophospholipase [Gammaproteobacteria bacterium]|nr:lysophospholipase [Gammaproteobacteria bacterium]